MTSQKAHWLRTGVEDRRCKQTWQRREPHDSWASEVNGLQICVAEPWCHSWSCRHPDQDYWPLSHRGSLRLHIIKWPNVDPRRRGEIHEGRNRRKTPIDWRNSFAKRAAQNCCKRPPFFLSKRFPQDLFPVSWRYNDQSHTQSGKIAKVELAKLDCTTLLSRSAVLQTWVFKIT